MEANQWAQEIGGVKTMAEIGGPCSSSRAAAAVHVQSSSSSERKGRPQKDQVVNCPRCQSTNTKFCYYNNYSLTQPRYFCKTCRRYWTAGGTLRNVPVGGGSRKNRRSSSSSSSSASTQKIPDANMSNISQFPSSNPNHKIHDQGHDLNLTFPYGQEYHFAPQIQLFEFPRYETNNGGTGTGTVPPPHELIKPSSSAPFAALELLRNGFSSSSSNSHIIEASGQSTSDRVYNNVGFPFQELKPTTGLSFSVDRFGSNNRYAGSNGIIQLHDDQNNNNCEKVMFPLEASMKQNPAAGGALGDGSTHNHMQQQNKGQQISNGCWNGMLGGGAW